MITTSEQTDGLLNLVVRWGDQSRLKCANCTCYMRFPRGEAIVKCSRCGSEFEHIEGDLFRHVLEDADGD